MYDVIVIGAGIAGLSFACKASKFAKTLLLEANMESINAVKTNIIAEHNHKFLEDVDWNDKSIFPSPHLKSNYMGEYEDGIINSQEFGAPLGNICHTEVLMKNLLETFQNRGGIIKYESASKALRNQERVEIINNKGDSYSGKLIAIASGSYDFTLQRSLGFDAPDRYLGIYRHLYGEENTINENMDENYIFHLNPNISTNGPFFINKGKGRVSIGCLGNQDTSEDLADKLERIINNYKRIQPFIKGLKPDAKPVIGYISKHPIKKFSRDNAIVLGESAGLVTAFFYEGILGGIASADIAAKAIKPLFESNSSFNQSDLTGYDAEIKRILLSNWFRSGEGSEDVFYHAGSGMKLIWNLYTDIIRTNPTLRRYIWEAYRIQDLENYDTKRDRWVGEILFKKLPTLSKLTLGPLFLKALLK